MHTVVMYLIRAYSSAFVAYSQELRNLKEGLPEEVAFELSLSSWHFGRWRFGKERNFTRFKEPLKIPDAET